jgi:uncharacterized protein (UPF0297 family)
MIYANILTNTSKKTAQARRQLIISGDPYYMEEFKEEEQYLKTFEDEEIEKLAVKNIVTNFEDIIKLITK